MKIVLTKPVEIRDATGAITSTILELNFREELCAGDLRGIPAGRLVDLREAHTEDLLKVAGRLCGRSEAELAKLGIVDLGEVLDAVIGFFVGGRSSPGATR